MPLHRHTTRVKILRNFLPVLAVTGLVIVTLWPAITEFKQNQLAKYSITRARIESIALTAPASGQPPQLQVTHPQFTGRDTTGRPYLITADRVMQGLQAGAPMTLDKPVAKLVLDKEKNQTATLQGGSGVYDAKNQTLTLTKDVVLTHSDGYTLSMQDLFVDLTKGLSKTQTAVTGNGPAGHLEAESLELRDKGNHIILHGRSKVILTPQSPT